MGNSFSNIAVGGTVSTVAEFLRGMSGSFYVAPIGEGWSGVYPSRDVDDAQLAGAMSRIFPKGAISSILQYSDVLLIEAFKDGERVALHNTFPEYFPDLDEEWKGRASVADFMQIDSPLFDDVTIGEVLTVHRVGVAEGIHLRFFDALGLYGGVLQMTFEDWESGLADDVRIDYSQAVVVVDREIRPAV